MGGVAELQRAVQGWTTDVAHALSPDAAKVSRVVDDLVSKFGADTLRVSENARQEALKGAYAKGGPKIAAALLDRVAEGVDKTPLSDAELARATSLAEHRFGPLDNLRFTRGFNPNEVRFSGDLFHIGAPSQLKGTLDLQSGTITKPFIERTGEYSQMTAADYKNGVALLKDAVSRRGLQPTGYTLEQTTTPGVLKYKFMPQPGQFEVGRLFLNTGEMRPVREAPKVEATLAAAVSAAPAAQATGSYVAHSGAKVTTFADGSKEVLLTNGDTYKVALDQSFRFKKAGAADFGPVEHSQGMAPWAYALLG